MKFLNAILDPKLLILSHLNYIISQSYSTFSLIRRFGSHSTDSHTLKLLFTSLVRSKLEYDLYESRIILAILVDSDELNCIFFISLSDRLILLVLFLHILKDAHQKNLKYLQIRRSKYSFTPFYF